MASLSASLVQGAIGLCMLAVASCRTVAPRPTDPARPDRVLFVGNSLTFFNDGLHTHYGNLLRAAGRRGAEGARVRQFTLAGARLGEIEPAVAPIVGEHGYDFVVLQGHSTEPIGSRAGEFKASVRRLVETLRGLRVEPVLLMTWAFQDRPSMTEPLAQTYDELGDELHVLVIPVGLAFERARAELPNVSLFEPDFAGVDLVDGMRRLRHQKDVKHPSRAGTYLMACTAYAALVKESPVGNAYHADLDADTAMTLQAIAGAVVASRR